MISVVLADSQRISSEGIKLILEGDNEIKVVGFAASISEVLLLCENLNPDIVLMDITMLGRDGVTGAKLITNRFETIKVIILTECKDNESIFRAMNSGANGYMLKDINPEELIMAVKSVALGLSVLHKDVFISVTEHVSTNGANAVLNKSHLNVVITERELSIIRYIIEGKENREIALNLYMSEGTIKNAISGILRKLDLKDRIQLVVFVLKNNLV